MTDCFRIQKCPDCVIVKKDADKLAEIIAQYTDVSICVVAEFGLTFTVYKTSLSKVPAL